MPTLGWMGKSKVVAYHRQVPYRVLERIPEKSVLDSHGSDCGNMVIHGDNLEGSYGNGFRGLKTGFVISVFRYLPVPVSRYPVG